MAPRRLSDSEKESIVELYRQPGQTTSTLAEEFSVSNSTISRILKLNLSAEEYKALVSQKRMGGGAANATTQKAAANKQNGQKAAADRSAAEADSNAEAENEPEAPEPEAPEPELPERSVAPPKLKGVEEADTPSPRRRRRRSAAAEADEQLPLLAADEPTPTLAEVDDEDDDDEDDLTGLDETLGEDFGDDDDLDEDLDDDDDDESDEVATPKPKLQTKTDIQIMPLGEAVLPKPCYLVVDMRAELITRPLIEFADLGKVPTEEERAKTLPVFDNHRVARRFSRNKQRVIKVPDGSLITRTSPYLAAKGITRLLVDGQVFDLGGDR